MTEKIYRDESWLYQQYVIKGLTVRQVAELAGCSKSTVQRWLAEYGYSKHSEGSESLKKQFEEVVQAAERLERLAKERGISLSSLLDEETLEFVRFCTEKERKRNLPPEKQSESRVVHRLLHPSDRVEHGGGQPISARHYDARSSGRSFAEEMDEIQEIHDKIGL